MPPRDRPDAPAASRAGRGRRGTRDEQRATSNFSSLLVQSAWAIRCHLRRGGTSEASAVEERESALIAASQAAFKAADEARDYPVAAKHLPGAAGNWSRFAWGIDPLSAIEEALRSPHALFTPNPVEGAFRLIADLGRVVGSRGETAIRVVVGDGGSIWTAFPVKS